MPILPKSWSATLTLPKSRFPARALVADRPRYLKNCTDDLYAWQKTRKGRETFALQDGPPFANGSLHIGHALNKILKDITNRFQLLQGKQVIYVPGWDCHGLPIELKALQQQRELGILGLNERQEPVAIRNAARNLALEAIKEQRSSFRAWGIMGDWDNSWHTMDKQYEMHQLKVFEDLVHLGLVHRRYRPVYWSSSSATALAEAELEYREDHVSSAAFVKFRINTLPPALSMIFDLHAAQVSVLIWTTTPWTLPANRAIGVHKEIQYVLVESTNHGFLIVAKSRLNETQKFSTDELRIKSFFHGFDLLGATYTDVFDPESQDRPFLHASFVNPESGTGLVHIAPGHGMDDYELCGEHHISAFAPVDDEGRFTAMAMPKDPQFLYGKEVLTSGNSAILEHLKLHGNLFAKHQYTHKYPYDWRSKRPVIIRVTEQWFVNVGEMKQAALESLTTVTFIPESGKERLKSFVLNRNEWCISRQRAWGVPVPALFHINTGQAVLNPESVAHIISTIGKRGSDAWWTDDVSDPAWTPPWLRDEDGQTSYVRGKDTMDVWIDSGTSWTQMNRSEESHVADVYLEGSDQHRGWFQSSLLTHVAVRKKLSLGAVPTAPFKTLITHGFTLDQNGRKMSKSVGNVVSPDEIMEGTLLPPIKKKKRSGAKAGMTDGDFYDSMGPDALRLWVGACDYTRDVVVGGDVLKLIHGNLSKYRVTFKLLLGLLDDFSPSPQVRLEYFDVIHQIALMQLYSLEENVQKHYQNFEYNKVVNEINKYIHMDLSAFYIESIKDAVYAGGEEANRLSNRQMAQHTLYEVFVSLQLMLAPLTPLLVEETWDYTPGWMKTLHKYPFHQSWGSRAYRLLSKQDRLEKDLPTLLLANAAVKRAQEAARSDKKMGSSLQSFVMLQLHVPLHMKSTAGTIFDRYRQDLETIFVVSKADICFEHIPAVVTEAEWSYTTDFDVHNIKVTAHIYSPQKAKCVRCWRYAASFEASAQAALCERCAVVVEELRETNPEIFDYDAAEV